MTAVAEAIRLTRILVLLVVAALALTACSTSQPETSATSEPSASSPQRPTPAVATPMPKTTVAPTGTPVPTRVKESTPSPTTRATVSPMPTSTPELLRRAPSSSKLARAYLRHSLQETLGVGPNNPWVAYWESNLGNLVETANWILDRYLKADYALPEKDLLSFYGYYFNDPTCVVEFIRPELSNQDLWEFNDRINRAGGYGPSLIVPKRSFEKSEFCQAFERFMISTLPSEKQLQHRATPTELEAREKLAKEIAATGAWLQLRPHLVAYWND